MMIETNDYDSLWGMVKHNRELIQIIHDGQKHVEALLAEVVALLDVPVLSAPVDLRLRMVGLEYRCGVWYSDADAPIAVKGQFFSEFVRTQPLGAEWDYGDFVDWMCTHNPAETKSWLAKFGAEDAEWYAVQSGNGYFVNFGVRDTPFLTSDLVDASWFSQDEADAIIAKMDELGFIGELVVVGEEQGVG